jgi:hypothetical protein
MASGLDFICTWRVKLFQQGWFSPRVREPGLPALYPKVRSRGPSSPPSGPLPVLDASLTLQPNQLFQDWCCHLWRERERERERAIWTVCSLDLPSETVGLEGTTTCKMLLVSVLCRGALSCSSALSSVASVTPEHTSVESCSREEQFTSSGPGGLPSHSSRVRKQEDRQRKETQRRKRPAGKTHL